MSKKTVIVTGGSRGIGRATVIEFAKNDYNVVINYKNSKDKAEELRKYIEETYNVSSITLQADVSKEDDVKKMLDRTLDAFSRIDVLVNNAGVAHDNFLEYKTVDEFLDTINTNLIGVFLTCKYIGGYMFNHKSGSIINVSSTNGIDTLYPESMDYDASKAGVISLTKNFANLYAPFVRVNSLAPGWVNTDMSSELDRDFIAAEKEKIMLKRFADVSEIAKVIRFLASDDASYIDGTVVRVDGGFQL